MPRIGDHCSIWSATEIIGNDQLVGGRLAIIRQQDARAASLGNLEMLSALDPKRRPCRSKGSPDRCSLIHDRIS